MKSKRCYEKSIPFKLLFRTTYVYFAQKEEKIKQKAGFL
jgi:hypothetical protein